MSDKVIVLTGVEETVKALKEFDKKAVRGFNKVINEELMKAESLAKGFIPMTSPMSGWREAGALKPKATTRGGAGSASWNSSNARAGIKKSRSQGRVRGDYTTSVGKLLQQDAAGAIFEVAGRKSSGQGTGANFISVLNTRFNKSSRAIWRAADQLTPEIEVRVLAALNIAKIELTKHLNKRKD